MVEGEEIPGATPPESPTPPAEPQGEGEGGDKVMALLCYLGILVVIPLLVKKDDAYVKFHAKQGLVLLIAWIILSIIFVIPFVGWVVGFIGYIILLVLGIIGIVNALSGKMKPLPIVGKFAEKFKF